MSRAQVGLRIVIFVLASWIIGSAGGFGLVYLAIPVVAAVLISQKGGERYVAEDADRVIVWLRLVVGALSYLALLTDELPTISRPCVSMEVRSEGTPSVGGALLRILKAIPSAICLAVLGFVGWIIWIVAAVGILLNERYPESLWRFQLGVVRWQANLLAYLTSLISPYPPFVLDRT